ncbi:hypothetical protein [Ekhidna sp.]|uniref:hypothetical protein n=1 Tax=Ekhidna sp. TaxID=2608089 RepID=UPI0035157785
MSSPFKIDHSKLTKQEQRSITFILAVSVLISLTFMIYAFMKVNQLEDTQNELKVAKTEIERLNDQAVIFKEQAMAAAAEALKVQTEAARALKECESK